MLVVVRSEEENDQRRWAGFSPLVSVIFPSSNSQHHNKYTQLTANYSPTLYYYFNKNNNMQSVKCRLENIDFIINYINNNCIIKYNDYLIYNISVIICVPQVIISTRYNNKTMTHTKNLGAFPRFWNVHSQNNDKCDYIHYKYIRDGSKPHDSIPDAIIVQGRPHLHSFNNMNPVYAHALFALYKSDYIFVSRHTFNCHSDALSIHKHIEISQNEENKDKLQNIKDNNVSGTINHLELYPVFRNGDYTFASLLKIVAEAPLAIKKAAAANVCIPSILRLVGGGESSLNTPSGWGSPPSSNNSNGNNSNWGNNSSGGPTNNSQQWVNNQRPPTSQSDSNSNKMNSGNGNNSGNAAPPTSAGSNNSSTSNWGPSTQSQTQQANNGSGSPGGGGGGGGSTPGSGAPSTPPQATATAKSQLEQLNTMRESLFSLDGWGGQHVNQDTNWDVPNSPEPGVKMDQPGGIPPTWKPNINNGTDLWEANLRNGGQPPPQPVAKTPWGHTPTNNIGGTWGEDDDTPDSNNVWNGPPPPQQWGAPPQHPPHWNASVKKDDWGGWGEAHRNDIHRSDMHRAPAPDPRDMRTMMGDMRGISGRLNGSGDMWGQHHMQHGMQPPNKIMPTNVANGVNQWGAQGAKDMALSKGGSGWEEPSPPAARRNMTNFDDGTSLWGQQRGSASVGMGPWKDMAGGMGRGTMPCPPGIPPNRLPGVAPNSMKPDSMWGQHPHRNGSWEDPPGHNSTNWEKDSVNSWNENPMNPSGSGWPGPKTKPAMAGPGGSWDADMGDWCGPKPPVGGPPAKLLPKDVIWNSKQFRFLADMGYKKEDIEQALRSRDMNADEALDLLSQMRGNSSGGIDSWRRHDEHPGGPPFDHPQQYQAAPPRQHTSFPPQQPPSSGQPFAQPANINNMSPAMVQKIMNPSNQGQGQFSQQNNPAGGGGQPTTAQLRMLVHQIQMAVSAGYLNHQILNQPLAPQTLLLLNQLLQQIKHLQKQANQQTMMQNSMTVGRNNSAFLQLSYQMTKTKQQISNLQSQITAQQTLYIQQQANNGGGGGGGASGGPSSSASSTGDFFNKHHDPLAQLQNNFAEITLNKEQSTAYGGGSGQQSRLNQWKLPSLDKDVEGSEFSRAPGTTSKSATSPQLNPLVLQGDNTWSSGVRGQDGWPSTDASDLPDGKDSWPTSQHSSTTPNISDLIPEFEPGKPWKGNQMKSIEDDPAITPGSVARSPLSLATIKEPDNVVGVGGKLSPNTPSLSSSTWTYPPPPPSSTPTTLNIPKNDALWGAKGTPPGGRPPNKTTPPTAAWAAPAPPRSQSFHHQGWPSTWLLLKNLTTQIDGSTLKTLCMQHGPLQSFHLYLNQSIALAKYNTREEASKAQTALNNCVLGNTTIFAESPAETDVKLILQHLGQGGSGGAQWRGGGGGGGNTTPSGGNATNDWSFPSLWSESDQRATPSSLSFLPPDLLGGESM